MPNSEFASKNFRWSELECKCGCGTKNISENAIQSLQLLRDVLNRPLTITSAARCPTHNHIEGGATNSRHISTPTHSSDAFDILVHSLSEREEIIVQGRKLGFLGVGRGKTFVHLDVRPSPAEWTYD
jgi:hypothetical protein